MESQWDNPTISADEYTTETGDARERIKVIDRHDRSALPIRSVLTSFKCRSGFTPR